MAPEQRAGIPKDTLDDIDLLCEMGALMERYMQGGSGLPYSEFEKAQKLINETLEGYPPKDEGYLHESLRFWCPEAADVVQGVLNEKLKARQQKIDEEKGTPTPSIQTFPTMPIPVLGPMRLPQTQPLPTPTPSGGRLPTIQLPDMPMPALPTPFEAGFGKAPAPSVQTTSIPAATSSGGSSATGDCPPGQFPAYPGGPCRGAVATGGLPGLPGGMGPAADVAQGAMSMPAMPAGSFGGLMGRFPVMNLG